MRIILLKHPESSQDVIEPTDALPIDQENSLTDQGRAQARAVAEAIADMGGDVIVHCSPSLRCREAADIVAEVAGSTVEVVAALADRRMTSIEESRTPLAKYRAAQEQVYLAPFDAAPGDESAVSHRLRVEAWLAERLAAREPDLTLVIVTHGAVVEHLQSALCWKPAGAMGATFTMCRPAHAHVWVAVEVPDGRVFWCLMAANHWLPARDKEEIGREASDLATLSAQLASAPAFEDLAREASTPLDQRAMPGTYYIR